MDTHTPTFIERVLGYIQIAFIYVVTAVMMFLPAQPGNFALSLSEPVTTESEKIVVEYKNETRRTIYASGDFDFILEEKIGEEWAALPFSQDYYILESSSSIMPTLSSELTINLRNAFGHILDKGDYRLTFNYSVLTSAGGNTEKMTAQLIFTVC